MLSKWVMAWLLHEQKFVFETTQGRYKLFFLTTTCYILQVLAFKMGKNLKLQLIDFTLQFLFSSKPPFPPSSSTFSCFSTNIDFSRNIKFHPVCAVYMSLKIRSHSPRYRSLEWKAGFSSSPCLDSLWNLCRIHCSLFSAGIKGRKITPIIFSSAFGT